MARLFAASGNVPKITGMSSAPLNGPYAGAWTISLWFKPTALDAGLAEWLVSCRNHPGNAGWGVVWQDTGNDVEIIESSSTGGTDAWNTSSQIALTQTDVDNGVWVAWRYEGSGNPYTRWKNGNKTTINATADLHVPPITLDGMVFGKKTSAAGNVTLNGALAEIAIWNIALTDAQMADLHSGCAADQFSKPALLNYWPLRGNDPADAVEPDYVGLPDITTGGEPIDSNVSTGTVTTHPRIIAPTPSPQYCPAYVLEVKYGGVTHRVASTDLATAVDADVIGGFARGRIINPNSISVRHSLSNNHYGIAQASTSTIVMDNSGMVTPLDYLTDLQGWWTPSIESVHRDGTALSQWKDISGQDNHAAQAGGPFQPSKESEEGTVIVATASSSHMDTGINIASGSYTVMVAMAPGTDAVAIGLASIREAVSGQASSSSNGWELGISSSSGSSPNFVEEWSFNDGFAAVVYGGTVGALGEWAVLTVVHDGTDSSFYVNGVLKGTVASAAYVNDFTIGGDNTSLNWLGDIAVWDAALTGTERRAVERHWMSKWGVDGNGSGVFDPAREWRDLPAILRRYDRLTHEYTVEISGVIVGAQFPIGGGGGHRASLTVSSHNNSALATLVPKHLVNVDQHPTATDLGAPIPIVCGTAYMSPPFIKFDEENAPGGTWFAVSHIDDRDGAAMGIKVTGAWWDIESGNPGMEQSGGWEDAPNQSGITYVSTTTFTVSNDQEYKFQSSANGGMPFRCKTDASGSDYVYSHVTGYSSGTVTIADAILDSGMKEEQVLGEYMIEEGTIGSDTEDIVAITYPGLSSRGGLVVQATNDDLTSPVDIIEEILENSVWGLGLTTDSVSFGDAYDSLPTNLQSVNGTIGGNRQPRPARDIINELLAIYGGRLWYDGDDEKWHLSYDATADASTLTLGFGDGVYNNIKEVVSYGGVSLEESVKSINLRYGPKWRIKSNDLHGTVLATSDTNYEVSTDGLPIGTNRTMLNPWLDNYNGAAATVTYTGRRYRIEDKTLVVKAGMEARFLSVGELVDVRVPHLGIRADMRVRGINRNLPDTQLTLVPYDSSLFDAPASGEVEFQDGTGANTSTDTIDIDDTKHTLVTPGGNFVVNSDFSVPMREDTSGTLKSDALPGWRIGEPGDFSTLTLTESSAIAGARYLTATVSTAGSAVLRAARGLNNLLAVAIPVTPGQVVLFSCYADTIDNFHFQAVWYEAAFGGIVSTTDMYMRCNPNDTNGKGWSRCFGIARAVATSGYVEMRVKFDNTGTTEMEAFQAEYAGVNSSVPSPYSRSVTWEAGIAGLQTVTATETITLSGASTDTSSAFIPAGAILLDVTSIMSTAETGGATGLNLGTAASADLFAQGTAVSAATTTDAVNDGSSSFVPATGYGSNTAIRATAVGTNWSDGVLRITVVYATAVGPEQT